jgi:hypothetical protein
VRIYNTAVSYSTRCYLAALSANDRCIMVSWILGSKLHGIHQRIHQRPRVWDSLLQPRGTVKNLRMTPRQKSCLRHSGGNAPISHSEQI